MSKGTLGSVMWLGIAVLLLAACGGGSGGSTTPVTEPTNEAPVVTVTWPTTDIEIGMTLGGTVEVRCIDDDPDDVATTDVYADRDGDLSTTADQIVIVSGVTELDGVEQSTVWDVTGSAPGLYRIIARTSDGNQEAIDEAPGHVLLNAAPTLSITGPALDLSVSRGVRIDVTYADDDEDDSAMTVLFADRDGDPGTTFDAYDFGRWQPDGDGATQVETWNTRGVADGEYTILGQIWDGTNPLQQATAPGRVTVRNVGWAQVAGGTGSDDAHAIASFPDGSCVVTGYFRGTATFGEGAAAVNLTSDATGQGAVFVARYDADGTLAWAKMADGATSTALGEGICAYPNGSCVVVGVLDGVITFGEGTAEVTLDATATNGDLFVARYDANGVLEWAKKAGGPGFDEVTGVAVGPSGSCVVAGAFDFVATFGEGTAQVILTPSGGGTMPDVFLAKYDVDGNLSWAVNAGGSSEDFGRSIATFPDGSCVVTGIFAGTATFGEAPNDVDLVSLGSWEAFLARYDTNGVLIWARRAGGTSADNGRGVSAWPDGSCVVTGTFSATATFGEGAAATDLVSTGSNDVFLARYDEDGVLVWAVSAGGTQSDYGSEIAASLDGSCVVTGAFRGTATFGEGAAAVSLVGDGTSESIFAARYRPDGTLDWARKSLSTSYMHCGGVSALADGSYVVAGTFKGTVTLGGGAPVFDSRGGDDIYIARFNADGDY